MKTFKNVVALALMGGAAAMSVNAMAQRQPIEAGVLQAPPGRIIAPPLPVPPPGVNPTYIMCDQSMNNQVFSPFFQSYDLTSTASQYGLKFDTSSSFSYQLALARTARSAWQVTGHPGILFLMGEMRTNNVPNAPWPLTATPAQTYWNATVPGSPITNQVINPKQMLRGTWVVGPGPMPTLTATPAQVWPNPGMPGWDNLTPYPAGGMAAVSNVSPNTPQNTHMKRNDEKYAIKFTYEYWYQIPGPIAGQPITRKHYIRCLNVKDKYFGYREGMKNAKMAGGSGPRMVENVAAGLETAGVRAARLGAEVQVSDAELNALPAEARARLRELSAIAANPAAQAAPRN